MSVPVKFETDTVDFSREVESGAEESAPSAAQAVPEPTLQTLRKTLVAYLAEEDSDSESEPELASDEETTSSRPRFAYPSSLESAPGVVIDDSGCFSAVGGLAWHDRPKRR